MKSLTLKIIMMAIINNKRFSKSMLPEDLTYHITYNSAF